MTYVTGLIEAAAGVAANPTDGASAGNGGPRWVEPDDQVLVLWAPGPQGLVPADGGWNRYGERGWHLTCLRAGWHVFACLVTWRDGAGGKKVPVHMA
eukprot:gene14883-biopygen1085